MKYMIGLFYPSLIVFFSIFVYQNTQIKQLVHKNVKTLIIYLVVSFVFGNIFLYLHLSQEQYIYFWDFSGFWRKTIEFVRSLEGNPLDALKFMYESMLYQEYSYFPEMFLALPISLIGETFPRFVVAMFNFFVMPANAVLAIIAFWIQDQFNIKHKWFMFVVLSLICLFTANILPMKLGYIGSAGLPFIGFIILVILTDDFEEMQVFKSIFIGVNLVLLVLIRRWFSYVAVSFFIAYPIAFLIDLTLTKQLSRHKIQHYFINTFIMGSTSLVILLIGFFPLVNTFVSYDYQLAYQSARVGGYLYALEWFITFYSPLLSLIFFLGLTMGLFHSKVRRISLFFAFSIFIVIFLFYRIQVFGSHHYYIINMYVAFFILMGFGYLLRYLPNRFNSFMACFLAVAMMANFMLVFVQRNDSIVYQITSIFQPLSTKLRYPPRYRADVDTVRDISDYLDSTPSAGEYVYVLSGSANLNDDLLRNAWFPEKFNSVRNIEPTMQLDTRDGIPKLFFKYSYIVVADPIQYHNGEDYQKVIGILADGMLRDEALKKYYSIEKTFTIIDDIKVYVYKLIEDIPKDIIDKYREKYKAIYPDYPFLYEFDY